MNHKFGSQSLLGLLLLRVWLIAGLDRLVGSQKIFWVIGLYIYIFVSSAAFNKCLLIIIFYFVKQKIMCSLPPNSSNAQYFNPQALFTLLPCLPWVTLGRVGAEVWRDVVPALIGRQGIASREALPQGMWTALPCPPCQERLWGRKIKASRFLICKVVLLFVFSDQHFQYIWFAKVLFVFLSSHFNLVIWLCLTNAR